MEYYIYMISKIMFSKNLKQVELEPCAGHKVCLLPNTSKILMISGHNISGEPFQDFEHPQSPMYTFDLNSYEWEEVAVTSHGRNMLERSNFGFCQTADKKKAYLGQ